METYQTFPTSAPPPDKTLLVARVDGQDDLLDYIEEPLVGRLIETVETQEGLLLPVYRTLTAHAGDLVTKQGAALDPIVDALTTRLGTMLANQTAALTQVLSALPPEERDPLIVYVPAPPPPAPVPPPPCPPPTVVTVPVAVPIGSPVPTVPPPIVIHTPAPPTPPGVPPIAVPPPPPPPPGTTPVVTTSTTSGSNCPAPVVNVTVNCPTPTGVSPPPPPGTSPPTPPTPTLVPSPPVPPVAAASVAGWDTTSPTLCVTADTYVVQFASVGEKVRNLLLAGLETGEDILDAIRKLADIDYIGDLFAGIAAPAGVFANTLGAIRQTFTNYAKTFTGPRGDALLGLYFTKGILNTLSDATIGVNFVIQASVNLKVVPEQCIRLVDYLIQYLHPVSIPEKPEVYTLWYADLIDRQQAHCLASMHGVQAKEFDRQEYASRMRLTPDLEVKYWMRKRTEQRDIQKVLRSYGMTDYNEHQKLLELNKLLPPPSDAIRFSNRDVFDPDKLGRKEMEAEFKKQKGLREMFKAIGLEKVVIQTGPGEVQELDLPLMYYMASYEECSPTQVYEMLHRLRPNRVDRFPLPTESGQVVYPEPVKMDVVQSLLKEKDYNPIWRKRLAAISYRVPGRIDTRNMYRRGVFGVPLGKKGVPVNDTWGPQPTGEAEVELHERYQDMGYTATDASAMVLLDAIEYDRTSGGKGINTLKNRICKAYKLGAYTYAQAQENLTREIGDKQQATDFLNGCDLDMRIDDLRIAIAGVKKQWLTGAIDQQRARDLLRQYGVNNDRIGTLLSTWSLYRTVKTRELTAQQIGQYWEEGIINLADARARLVNLGYDTAAANLILNHVRVGQLAKSKKERDKVLRQQEAEQRRLQREYKAEVKEQQAAQERRLTRFLAGRSEKNLKEWLKAGEISEGEVRATFQARGWNPADIETWIRVNNPKPGVADE